MTHHQHFAPSAALKPFIKCFHSLAIDDGHATSAFERFTPDGCYEVNFNLAGSPARKDVAGEHTLAPGYTVARSSACYFMRPAGTLRLVGVRFHPWGLHRFTSMPMEEISDRAVPSTGLFGHGINALHERLAEADDMEAAMAELDAYFRGRLDAHVEDTIATDAARRLQASNGLLPMTALLAPYGITQRRFQQRFKQRIGTTPKSFSRLMRFKHTLRQVTADAHADPQDLAYTGNYYDQAHFVNEFRSFAGVCPSGYLAETHPLNDAAVLDS